MQKASLTKDQFLAAMTDLKVLKDINDEINTAMRKLSPDFGGFHNEKAEALILFILQSAMDDESEWISYFIYDLKWGKKYKDGCITERDGSIIKLETLEDLYNLLTS